MRFIHKLAICLLFFQLEAALSVIDGRRSEKLYHVDLPPGWEREEVVVSEDTRLPIAVFRKGGMKCEVHNFPDMKIAPESQIERWKSKLEKGFFYEVVLQSFSGYRGERIESKGLMGWALELPGMKKGEVGAPVTIKITGDEEEMVVNREELIGMGRSFELSTSLN